MTDQSRNENQQQSFEETSDFANYFCSYEFLYHQKSMLEDQRRMGAYFGAIMQNKANFKDKVVLDMGAGSGILAIWAAQAGARKVYAVEATKVAAHARSLVAANGLEGVVEVIQASVEDVQLPEQVDIIVSEWMGYFLLRESMLDSLIVARDRWLKPEGAMYPSHAKMYIAPVFNEETMRRNSQYQDTIQEWNAFFRATKDKYGVDMAGLTPQFRKEQWEHYMQTASWVDMGRQDLAGSKSCFWEFDVRTITKEDSTDFTKPFSCKMAADSRLSGFCGWFSVSFEGCADAPTKSPALILDTSPGLGYTHWGQQLFTLHPTLTCCKDDVVAGDISILRRKENKRLYDIKLDFSITKPEGVRVEGPVSTTFHLL